jgi:hypothetical protein
MARYRASQYTFTRGQVGADLDFRSDIALYQSGAKTVTNAFVLPQGGIAKRRGFEYIATTPSALRIEKFAFSETQEYVMVLYNQAIQLYRNDTIVFDSAKDVYVLSDIQNGTFTDGQSLNVSNGSTGVEFAITGTTVDHAVTAANTYLNGLGISALNKDGYLQLYNNGTTNSIVIGSGTANGGLGMATGTYGLMSVPYTTDQISEIRMSQKFDAMFLVQKDTAPYELVRGRSDNDWTLSAMSFESIPFERFNVKQTLTPSGTSGSINLTLSGTDNYWRSSHVNSKVRVNGGYVNITSITSGLVAVGTVTSHLTVTSLTGTGADEGWGEEVWSTAHGYPRTVTQHQARLIFGGTRDLPQTVVASSTGSFTNFDTDTTDADRSWTKNIGTQKVNVIQSVLGRSDLHVFTNDGHYIINGDEAITPTTGRVQQQNAPGINTVPPVEIYQNILFITDDNKTLQMAEYDSDVFEYKSSNLTTLQQDLMTSPIDMSYVANYTDTQTNLVFIVNSDGTGVVLSIDTEKEVFGWSKFETTNGSFVGTAEVDDALYVLVQRSLADSTAQVFLEKLTERKVYLDHFYTGVKLGNPKDDWSGATTLAGQTVACVISQDSDIETCTVHENVIISNAGAFNTTSKVRSVGIGYNYTGIIETLPLAFAINGQLIRGERYRKVKAELRVRNSQQFTVDDYTLSNRLIGQHTLNGDLPNIDSIVPITLSGIGNNLTVTIKSALPLPLQINGLTVDCRFSA